MHNSKDIQVFFYGCELFFPALTWYNESCKMWRKYTWKAERKGKRQNERKKKYKTSLCLNRLYLNSTSFSFKYELHTWEWWWKIEFMKIMLIKYYGKLLSLESFWLFLKLLIQVFLVNAFYIVFSFLKLRTIGWYFIKECIY